MNIPTAKEAKQRAANYMSLKGALEPKEEQKQDYSGVHVRHCYQGEYEDGCKYGEDDCPAKPLEKPKQETLENPVIIVRNDDGQEFIHLSNGMYRTKWGILNNSISKTPLVSFDKSKFTFYYE